MSADTLPPYRLVLPLTVLALLAAASCGPRHGAGGSSAAPAAVDPAYRAEIAAWHEDRLAHLTADDGWLTLVALDWLHDGDNSLGRADSNTLILPGEGVPDHLGTIHVDTDEGGEHHASITVRPGVGVTADGKVVGEMPLATDASGSPTVLHLGTVSFYVIERGDRLALRVKDSQSATREEFRGIETYPVDPAFRFEARFEPYDPPKKLPIANVLGMTEEDPSPGAVVFEKDGKTYRLDALKEDDQLFLIVADATSGKTTYGAGRYLYTAMPGPDGRMVVDFNKLYNPPCAFTSFATCPLPPKQNRLPFAVTAGEKFAGHGTH